MDISDYVKLQDKTIKENKESYYLDNGIRYINIANCDRMYWNATSIIEFLISDIDIDNSLKYVSFSKFNKMLCRIINSYKWFETDKKVKDWIVRNNRLYSNKNNKEFNKLIRNNYVFYFENKHNDLYR